MSETTQSAARAMTSVATRTNWNNLPEQVRMAIEWHAGTIHQVDTISSGLNASFIARLRTDRGFTFAKGMPADRATAQRREAEINVNVQPIGPRLLWQIDSLDWHILGFEHVNGRAADLCPGSTDLLGLAGVLGQLAKLEAPRNLCRRIEDRWADAAQRAGVGTELLVGDHLLHTDLNPHNILVTDSGTRIVDWSWPTLGAGWIDTACAALWLIAEGHSPADAESWASTVAVWAAATPEAVDVFTAISAVLWGQIAAAEPRCWKRRLHRAATAWVTYRAVAV
jgi:Phosphotransferase enzyme family